MRPAELRRAVRDKYREVSGRPEGQFPYPCGRASATALGYEPAWLDGLPDEVCARFVGVGNPFSIGRPAPGQRVLDLGCGCGMDVLVAARLVGPGGRAVGIDLTPEMLAVARAAADASAWWVEGSVEALPFADGAFDVVVSNGALNLVPDKAAAFAEARRVLAPGGTLAVADLLVTSRVPDDLLASMDAWST